MSLVAHLPLGPLAKRNVLHCHHHVAKSGLEFRRDVVVARQARHVQVRSRLSSTGVVSKRIECSGDHGRRQLEHQIQEFPVALPAHGDSGALEHLQSPQSVAGDNDELRCVKSTLRRRYVRDIVSVQLILQLLAINECEKQLLERELFWPCLVGQTIAVPEFREALRPRLRIEHAQCALRGHKDALLRSFDFFCLFFEVVLAHNLRQALAIQDGALAILLGGSLRRRRA